MDVTMKKRSLACYTKSFCCQTVRDAAVESVVPDTMPDIDRILCADGNVAIRSKEASAGSVSVTAAVAASVVYMPDGEDGVCCVNASIPFSITLDAPGVTEDSAPVAMLTLCSVEAKILNPRKIVVRAVLNVLIDCYDTARTEYCEGLDGANDKIQLLVEKKAVSHIVSVREKTFIAADEYKLPAGTPAIGELAKSCVDLCVEDIKPVGTRLVVNGRAKITVLYTSDEKEGLCPAEFETSFSQLVETDCELNAPECTAMLMLTAMYLEPATLSGGERGLSAELHMVVQLVCSDNIEVSYIKDCYSNQKRLSETTESKKIECRNRRSIVHCSLHEQIDAGQDVSDVLEACGRVIEAVAEDGLIKCKVSVTVIYCADNGELHSVSRRLSAEGELDMDEGMSARPVSAWCSSMYAAPAQSSIDIRMTIEADTVFCCSAEIPQVVGIELSDEAISRESRPSLVVVRASECDSLWALAKKYGSTCDMISAANKIEAGECIAGKLMLVPAE